MKTPEPTTGKPHFHAPSTASFLLLLVITGCSGTGSAMKPEQASVTITSSPPRAEVLADGAQIGVTPLTIRPSDHFHTGFARGKDSLLGYRYVGKLAVRKAGCTDYVTEVDDNLLSHDIEIVLECDPGYQPPPAGTESAQPANTVSGSRISTPAEERLLRIEHLHDQDLISDDEYHELRQRVLDTL